VSRRVATGSRPAANAKVEVAVQIAERWIVARLRHQWTCTGFVPVF
jgi:transposase